MNILVLAHRIPYPPEKGEKIRTFHQISDLAKMGHKIHILTPRESFEDTRYQYALESLLDVTVELSPIQFKWYKMLIALATRQALTTSYFHSRHLQRLFDRRCSEYQIDAVLCTSSAMAKYVFSSSSLSNSTSEKPVLVMDFMDLDSAKWQSYACRRSFPMSWVYRRESIHIQAYEERIAKTFDKSIFVSNDEKRLFELTVPASSKKMYAIENGVDTTSYPYQPMSSKSRPLILLFTGVMNYYPNEDAVIWFVKNVWPSILGEQPGAKFIVAGMNPSSKVKALGSVKGVEITGYVNNILEYFNAAHIFVASFQFARGIQNKVLQAFSAGLPVVASSSAAEGLVAEDGKHYLIANTPDEYTKAILTLANDSELATEISSQARILVEDHYSWRSKNQELEKLLEAK